MAQSKLYTTDGKVKWFTNEDDVNSKLILSVRNLKTIEMIGIQLTNLN